MGENVGENMAPAEQPTGRAAELPTNRADVEFWIGAKFDGNGSGVFNAGGRAPYESHMGRALAVGMLCAVGWIPVCVVGAVMHWTVGIAWVTVTMMTLAIVSTVAGAAFVMRQKNTAAHPAALEAAAAPVVSATVLDATPIEATVVGTEPALELIDPPAQETAADRTPGATPAI